MLYVTTTAPSTVGKWNTAPPTLGHVLIGHRRIGGAEVHGARGELLDPAARADRLVVDLDAGRGRVVREPLAVDREREGGAGAVEVLGAGRSRRRRTAPRGTIESLRHGDLRRLECDGISPCRVKVSRTSGNAPVTPPAARAPGAARSAWTPPRRSRQRRVVKARRRRRRARRRSWREGPRGGRAPCGGSCSQQCIAAMTPAVESVPVTYSVAESRWASMK